MRVSIPEYGTFADFPDNLPQEEIQRALAEKFPSKKAKMPEGNDPVFNAEMGQKEPTPFVDVADFLTGHFNAPSPSKTPPEYQVDPETGEGKVNIPEGGTAESMPFLQDPATAVAFGGVMGAKAAGSLAKKALRGAQETVGYATGGASDVAIGATKAVKKIGNELTHEIAGKIADPVQRKAFLVDIAEEANKTGKVPDEIASTRISPELKGSYDELVSLLNKGKEKKYTKAEVEPDYFDGLRKQAKAAENEPRRALSEWSRLSDEKQVSIDARHDELDKIGMSWENQQKDPTLTKLYDERVHYDMAAMYQVRRAIREDLKKTLGDLGVREGNKLGLTPFVDRVIDNHLHFYPSLGAEQATKLMQTLDDKQVIKDLTYAIAEAELKKTNPTAELDLVLESPMSALTEKGKRELMENAARRAKQAIDGVKDTIRKEQEIPAKQITGVAPIVPELINAAKASVAELRGKVSSVRYGPVENDKGSILFDFSGKTYKVPEPTDVMPVGAPEEAANAWALRQVLDKTAKPYKATVTTETSPLKWAQEEPGIYMGRKNIYKADQDFLIEKEGNTYYVSIPNEDRTVKAQWHQIGKAKKLSEAKAIAENYGNTVTTGTLPKKSTETGSVDITPLKGFAKSWKEFWSPTSTMPQSAEYLKLRYKQFGDLDRVEGITKKVFDRTKNLDPAQKRDIFRYLDGQIELDQLAQESRSLASALRTMNDTIGSMLVKRGMLDPKVYEANKGQYVRYLYLKHVLGDKIKLPMSSGRLDLKYLKSRKDLTAEQRKAIGWVEDVSVAEPVGVSGPLSDIAKHDFMAKVGENPEWVWSPSFVKVGEQKWSIGKLAEEIDIQRKMLKQAPDVPEIKQRLDALEAGMKEAQANTKNVPDDFIQLPNSPHYGPLQGAFVRREIARDIQPVFTGFNNVSQLGKLANSLLRLEEKGMTAFKVGKTALNPPTMARNTISNMIQLNMSGMNLPRVLERTIEAAGELKRHGQYWKELRRNGGFKTNWGQAEIGEVLDTLKTMQGDSLGILGGINKVAKFYGKIDDLFRLAKYIDERKAGKSAEDAILEAQKWVMDYSLASPSIKAARRYAAPFLSYQYKIAPLVVESIKQRPWVVAKYMAIPYLMQEAAKRSLNLTEQDWKKLKRELPLYVKDNESYAILPWKSPEGKAQWVNLEYYLPWQNFLATGREAKQGNAIEAVDKATGMGNPFLDIYTVMKTTKGAEPPKDPFSGRDIYNKLDSPTDKAVKLAEWLYNKWAPSAFTRMGAMGYTEKAVTGEKDRYGRTVSPGQAAGRWVGFNVVAPSQQQTAKEIGFRRKQLQTSLAAIMKNPTIKNDEKQAAVKRFNEEMRKLGEAVNQ